MRKAAHFTELLAPDRLLALHAEGIRRFGGGGRGGVIEGCVEGSLGNAWTAEGYEPDEDKLPGLAFAGFALFYLAKNHCFEDGNKRAAWLAATAILGRLGLTVNCTAGEAEDMIEGVIVGRMTSGREVVAWLAGRLTEDDDSAPLPVQ